MLRSLTVIALAAACGKSSTSSPAAGSARSGPIGGCDPSKPFTEPQARAWFTSTGQTKVDSITIQDNDLDFHAEGQGIYELGAHPCCDIPHLTIAYFYNCKVYDDERAAVRDLLMSRGWARADPAKRVELAKAIDPLLGASLATPPSTWNPFKPFAPPTTVAQPDGSVKLRRWVHRPNCGGQGCDPSFALEETTLGIDGLTSAKTIEEYGERRSGYGDPAVLASCDPTKPPSKDYARAVYLDAGITNWTWDVLQLDELGHDMWVLHKPGTTPVQFIWRCKHAYDVTALFHDVEAAEGWPKAAPPTRIQIATMLDGWQHHVLDHQPATWDAKHRFEPPTATALPDGGVKLARWYLNFWDDAAAAPTYHHEEQIFTADGKLGLAKTLDSGTAVAPAAPSLDGDRAKARAQLDRLIGQANRGGPSDRGPPMTHEEKCQMDRDFGRHGEAGCSKRPPAPESVRVTIVSSTSDAVAEQIRTKYLTDIERCYRAELVKSLDHGVDMKVALGGGAAPSVTSPMPDVDACVVQRITTWKLDAKAARVELAVQLEPSYAPGILFTK